MACTVCTRTAAVAATAARPRESIGERGTLPTPAPTGLESAAPPAEEFSELQFDSVSVARPTPAPPPPSGAALDPALDYLVELQPGGRFRPWELRRPFYSVGREGAKISLADPRVSRRHLAVARAGPHWLAVNLSDKRLRVNGGELRQKTLRHGDVVRVGQTWLVFVAATPAQPPAPLRRMAGSLARPAAANDPGRPALPSATLGSLDEDESAAQISLHAGGVPVASSAGLPLLVGSHPACPAALSGPGVAPFHCVFTWLPDGPHVVDLSSPGGTLLGGAPVQDALVRDGQELTLGNEVLTVRLAGDPCAPAAARLRAARTTPTAVALTSIYGPHAGETAVLPPGRTVVLGHAPGADLHLPRDVTYVPPHLELTLVIPPGDVAPTIRVRVREEHRGVVVNRVPVPGEGTMGLGDVLQFGPPQKVGPTALLAHYDVCLDSW